VLTVLGGVGAMVVFAIVRKFAGRWWIWGSLAGRELAILAVAIAPVNIQPIFSKINRLDDPKVTTPILRIGARQRHSRARRFTRLIPAARPRVSASMSGLARTWFRQRLRPWTARG
jgi:STE24 endopeptidase